MVEVVRAMAVESATTSFNLAEVVTVAVKAVSGFIKLVQPEGSYSESDMARRTLVRNVEEVIQRKSLDAFHIIYPPYRLRLISG